MPSAKFTASLALLFMATPSVAQDWAVARHPNDKYISASDAAPASNWMDQPWYAPLAECSEVFKLAPSEHKASEMFAGTAADRIAKDRNLEFEDAYYVILPAFESSFRWRAKTMVEAYGADKVRAQCNALYDQYVLAVD